MLDSKNEVVGKLTRRWQMNRQRGYGFELQYRNVSKARYGMQKSSAGNRLQWKSLNVIRDQERSTNGSNIRFLYTYLL
jgi:hypothetical protein